MKRRLFLFSLGFIGSAIMTLAEDKMLLNLDKSGVAIQGYDPVAFFTVGAPVKGSPEFTSTYHAAVYQFHSAKNKATFDGEPAKYEPQFGGYCAYGVSRNALAPIDIKAWQIVDGRLLMQKSISIRDDFNEDTKGNLKKADSNWPKLLEKKGK